MTKIILNIILTLLVLAAVCGGLAWLLPVRVSVALLFIVQLVTLVILGSILKRNDHEQEEA